MTKQELGGNVEYLVNHLCVCKTRNLLVDKLSMQNLAYTILNGTGIFTSPPVEGKRLKISCVVLGYSRQVRTQWLSMYLPIELALVNVNPRTAMVLPTLDDFTYPTLIL